MTPIKLLLKVILITGIAGAVPIIYAIYLIRERIIGLFGFTVLWFIAGGVILLLSHYYVKPKVEAHLGSLPDHKVGI